jgi:geranylgeranyl diphosphate synthase, type I
MPMPTINEQEPSARGITSGVGLRGPGLEFGAWLRWVQSQTELALAQLLVLEDEERLDAQWSQALEQMRSYSLRHSKRLRPGLVLAGHAFARGDMQVAAGLWQFAAATELLHTFMLIHDDVADQAALRRGGPALHRMLGRGRMGQSLAIVAGDHLFSRAMEVMLGCGQPGTARAVNYFLKVCRHTAAGQYMDICLSHVPLAEVSLSQVLRVAYLKTALYGFSAPLACGALLAGAGPELVASLERLGRHLGTAYQLQDDLLGLYGDTVVCGKPTDADLAEGKRTFPAMVAWLRSSPEVRAQMEVLWKPGPKNEAMLERARELVEAHGGRQATELFIQRSTAMAERILTTLPAAGGMRELVGEMMRRLVRRQA